MEKGNGGKKRSQEKRVKKGIGIRLIGGIVYHKNTEFILKKERKYPSSTSFHFSQIGQPIGYSLGETAAAVAFVITTVLAFIVRPPC